MSLRSARLGSAVAVAIILGSLADASVASAEFSETPARTWGTNGRVNTILPVGNRVYVGGTFSAVRDPSGVSYPVGNIAVFDAVTGAADLSFQARTNGAVIALATDGAQLFIGGAFATVTDEASTKNRDRIAALDPGTGAVKSWAPKATGPQVDAIAYSSATGAVYVGGNITAVTGAAGSSSSRPFIAKIDAASGVVDGDFRAAPADRVRAINVAKDGSPRLFIGGDFLNVAGLNKTKSLAAVDRQTGAVDTSFVAGPTNGTASPPVFDITSTSDRVFVAVGGAGGACASLSASDGDLQWSKHANGNMQSVRQISGTLYCGGHFGGTDGFEGLTRNRLAAVEIATGKVLPFSPRVNSSLGTWALGAQPGDPNLYLGGDFTKVSGVEQPHYAQFIDSSLQGKPQAPSKLAGQPGHRVIHLSWSVPSSDGGAPITSYKIYRGLSPSGPGLAQPVATVDSSTRIYEDTTVENGVTYHYEVTAINRFGASEASNEVAVTPDAGTKLTVPSPPTALTATNPPGMVKLSWNPPVDSGGSPVMSYNVYRGTSPGGQGVAPHATGVSTTSFNDAVDVEAGTTYYYTVTAVNVIGESRRSEEVSALLLVGTPGRPELSGGVDGSVVTLSWTTPPDGGSPILKYVLLRDSVKLAGNISPSQNTFETSIAPGTTHVYQVKAVNAEGSGPLSNKVTISR